MALKLKNCARGGYLNILQTALSRHTHTGALLKIQKNISEKDLNKNLHASAPKSYPSAPTIPLPLNMTQIFGNETGRFTPERARDISGPVLICQTNALTRNEINNKEFNSGVCMTTTNDNDSYMESYDCTGAVSLNGSMQSNVPQPFSSEGKSMHLNMPGGQWARDDKYIADDMQNSHYARINRHSQATMKGKSADGTIIARSPLALRLHYPTYVHITRYSTATNATQDESKKQSDKSASNNESSAAKLKRAVNDYGRTVIVFHIGISLASLGICYVAISSGVDVPALIKSLGFVDDTTIQNVVSNSSTFVIAYAVHKLFAPVRISITLATTPFLVRYLRRIGVLKTK